MYKVFIVLIFSMYGVFGAEAQIPQNLKFQLQNSQPDSNRVNMLVSLGKYYLDRPSEFKKERDQAIIYFKQALRLSNALHLNTKIKELFLLSGKYYYLKNDTLNGNLNFQAAIKAYHRTGDPVSEAKAWEEFGDNISLANIEGQLQITCYQKAGLLFRSGKNKIEQMKVALKIARYHLNQRKTGLAEREMLEVLNQYRLIGFKDLQYVYDELADVNQAKSDLHKELQYRLAAIKSLEAGQDTAMAYYFYQQLATTYADLGEYDQSLKELMRSLAIMRRTRQLADYYGYLSLASHDLIAMGRPEAALTFLEKESKRIPPFNIAQREDLYECYGNAYAAMKQYQKAERYYLALMHDFKTTMFNRDYYTSNTAMMADFVHYNQTLGNFYLIRKQYRKAAFYQQQVLSLPKGTVRPVSLSQMHLNQFRIDSALGKYLSAIDHFASHKRINDSLFNVVKIKQIAEVQTNYQIRQKEQFIRMLKSQAKLETQKALLRQNLTFLFLGMVVIIAGLAYYGYRNKQRINFELQCQQNEINVQNAQLQELVLEKDQLITEKDWLLKEVHHRVKNNLQIVMSLLNTQSAYLKNSAAIEAISDSQNRVQAISLIHQKLYATSSVSNIDMVAYIHDLVEYLGDCFDTVKKGIRFKLEIEPVKLSLAQAIPIGLILNEGITNAVKYAFTEPHGQIIIRLKLYRNRMVLLTLADNGRGLARGFDIERATTLGMEMMKALSRQLNGEFRVKNANGVNMRLKFLMDQPDDLLTANNLF